MIYVVSDLHGCLSKWSQLLNTIHFGEQDTLFVLGDCVDFGPEPIGLLLDLMERPNVFPILGNHDLAFARCARMLPPDATMETLRDTLSDDETSQLTNWLRGGGQTTLCQFLALDQESRDAVLDYIGEMTLYEEVEADGVSFVLTHAGLDPFDPDRPLEDYEPSAFLQASPHPGQEYFADRTVIVGHVPTFRLEGGKPGKILDDGAIIYIDCGAGHPDESGIVGCLRLDDFAEFYV